MYTPMGNHSAALPLATKALAIVQRLYMYGNEHAGTLVAKASLAATHMHMGSHELALSLSMEVLKTERRCWAASTEKHW